MMRTGGIKNIFLKKIQKMSVFFLLYFVAFDQMSVVPQSGLVPLQKGINYVTWSKSTFSSKYSDESLQKLPSIGVEYISICVTYYQQKYNSTKIEATEQTPSFSSTRHVIKESHKLGLKVMLKPHIDLIDKGDGSYWRADIGFYKEEKWEKWFKSYETLILKYARLAQKTKTELFCIGTELSFTTQKNSYWLDLIKKVRSVYSGELVYAANWDNFRNIKFWNELDYVGVDAYFPLSYKKDPSLKELIEGWKKWKYELEQFREKCNKPIIFTEIGYASTSHAPQSPWQGGLSGNADPSTQAKCYEAFFKSVWTEPWLAGAYWWKWDTNTHAGGIHNRQFTPQNKPAEKIIAMHYKKNITI